MGSGINTQYLKSYSDGIITVINSYLVPVIFTIALLVILWGVAKAYILYGNSDAERAKGHKLILWGVIGLVVMVSIWGLVNVVQSLVGLSGAPTTSPKPPCITIGSTPC